MYPLLLISSVAVILDQHIKIPPNLKRDWRAALFSFGRDRAAHQSTVFLFGGLCCQIFMKTSVYKGYKQDKIEMRGDRAEMSDFPLYLNMVAGGLDCRDQAIGGFSFVVKIYAVPVVEIIG